MAWAIYGDNPFFNCFEEHLVILVDSNVTEHKTRNESVSLRAFIHPLSPSLYIASGTRESWIYYYWLVIFQYFLSIDDIDTFGKTINRSDLRSNFASL